MYRVTIESMSKFNQFFGIVDTEWVNLVIGDGGMLLMQDSNEIFAVLQLPCVHGVGDRPTALRVQKNLLAALCSEGILELTEIAKDIILLEMVTTAGFHRRVEIEKNKAYTAGFMDKFAVISNSEGNQFNANGLKRLAGMCKAMHSYVEVENGIAGMVCRNGTHVYEQAPSILNLCLSFKAASALFSCSSEWSVYKNYVFTASDLLGVLVTQCRGGGLSDYFMLGGESGRSALICDVDISDVLSVLPRLHATELHLNIRKQLCSVYGGIAEMEFPLKVSNLQIAERYDAGIVISVSDALGLLAKSSVLHINVKRHFTQIDSDGLTVLL